MANTTNFGWETPDDTDLVKDGAAAMRTLGSAIDTSLVDLKGGTTGQVLSKTSNTDMDFTWVTTDDTNAIQNAIVDAKGDLIAASAADTPARLAVGSNEHRLVADSTQTTGLKYVADTTNYAIAAKGDLLVGTAADTLSALSAGSNGDTLVADSAATTGLRWQGSIAAGKNFVINGGMDIWQRGTANVTTASVYTADRWQKAGPTHYGVSRQTTSDTTNLPNIQYSARIQRTNGSTTTSATEFVQSIESVNSIPLAGKTVTLSFYARKGANFSAASDNINIYIATGTGTDQNLITGFTSQTAVVNNTQTITSTWTRYTRTFSVGSTATQIGMDFYFTPVGTAGANDWFEITGVQLEIGSVATEFSRAGGTLQGELALAQRYYWRFNSNGTSASVIGQIGIAYDTSNISAVFKCPVTMRTTPTSLDYSNVAVLDVAASRVNITSVTILDSSPDNVRATLTASGFTAQRSYLIYNQSGVAGYIGYSAEL